MRTLIENYVPPMDERRVSILSSVLFDVDVARFADDLERQPPNENAIRTMLPLFAELIRLVEYMAVVGYFQQTLVGRCCSNAIVSDLDDLMEDRFGPIVNEIFGSIGNTAAHARNGRSA